MKPVLLLNSDYRPLKLPFGTTTAQQAINRIAAASGDNGCYPIHFYDQPIRTKNQENLVKQFGFTHWPSVIVTKEFKPRVELVGFNSGNLFIRDKGHCRYCGKKLTRADATWDHYVPTSRGGSNTWDNAVLACASCNGRKGNDMPTGEWKLDKLPHEPTYNELVAKSRLFPIKIYDKVWLDYLPKWEAQVTLVE